MKKLLITLLLLTSINVMGRGVENPNEVAQEILAEIIWQKGITSENHYRLQGLVRSHSISYELEKGIASHAIQFQDAELLKDVLRKNRLRCEDLALELHKPECGAHCVKALTEYGCSASGKLEGKTPMQRAASHGDHAKVVELIRAGASSLATDKDGNNAAHIAAAECVNIKAAAEILQRLRSARECRNNEGVVAMDIFLERLKGGCA